MILTTQSLFVSCDGLKIYVNSFTLNSTDKNNNQMYFQYNKKPNKYQVFINWKKEC